MITLADAAAELGLTSSTLRRQIERGSLRARKVGPVWTISRRELERYRAEHLGRIGGPGRPRPRREHIGPRVRKVAEIIAAVEAERR